MVRFIELTWFLFGVFTGVTFFFRVFIYVFSTLNTWINRTVETKTLQHKKFNTLSKAAAQIPPSMIESLCQVSRFDDNVVGDPIHCRAVFCGLSMILYQTDSIKILPDHRHRVVHEHFLYRINSSCVNAFFQRISQYHRHANKASRFSSIKGKCVILRAKEGLPLFLEDPATVMSRKIEAAKLERNKRLQAHTQLNSEMGACPAEDFIPLQLPKLSNDVESSIFNKPNSLPPYGSSTTGAESDLKAHDVDMCLGASHSIGKEDSSCDSKQRTPNLTDTKDSVPMWEWRCIAIKFPSRREAERWLNLLQGSPQTHEWVNYLMHLPKIDVLNSLLARLFFENTRTLGLHNMLAEKISKKLESVSKKLPEHVKGCVTLDNLVIGGEVPLFNNVSVASLSSCGDLSIDFDVLYRGGLILSFRFSITYRGIRVPDFIFHIKVLELAGRARLCVGPPPTQLCWIGTSMLPQLRLQFTQEVPSHDGILHILTKIMPNMNQLVSDLVKVKLFEDMVLPNMEEYPWPTLHDSSSLKQTSSHDDVSNIIM
ncbi:unnamed protein product [Phytomonas sp. Hart1]|nr:unnamed protein product [Phytomonas sp. Hart1]|eukprot:CCW70262.1 unnamed protein product [Phytomonas sp. isolate Hart1]